MSEAERIDKLRLALEQIRDYEPLGFFETGMSVKEIAAAALLLDEPLAD